MKAPNLPAARPSDLYRAWWCRLLLCMALGVWPGRETPAGESSGDLLTAIAQIRTDMPKSGSEGFVPPTTGQLAPWRTVIEAMWNRQWDTASNLVAASFPSYDLIRFTDTGYSNRVYYLLRELVPVTNGWGTVIVNPGFERDLAIEVPHPVYDLATANEGADMFRRTGARVFVMAGTHRCADAAVSPCDGTSTACGDGVYHISDMAHYLPTCFQTTHEFAASHSPALYAVSVHGHADAACPDIFLSNGRGTNTTALLAAIKASVLAAGGLTVAEAGDGSSACTLTGGTNVQGRFTNGSPEPCSQPAPTATGHFIHIEQRSLVRTNFVEYSKLIAALNANLPLADTDADGLPNAWEIAHNLDPYNPGDATGDMDGDGTTNRDEYLAGTDPRDATSMLRITEFALGQVAFPTVSGRTYRVEYADTLCTNCWSILTNELFGTGSPLQISDPTASQAPRRFYRIGTQP